MNKVHFLFGIHIHQPIGNLDGVIENAYRQSYEPLLNHLFRHPQVRWNLHCTGPLWEWLDARHPETVEKIGAMVSRNQLELLSGGYYEPILPVIPDADKLGQIQKLNRYLQSKFQRAPKGMWCAERVWEPHLPKTIREAGMEYTILDDTHFAATGLTPDHLYGYYKTQEQHDLLDVFPISKDLRYAIPFLTPEKTIEIFKKASAKSFPGALPALTMADDGEKFGLWPNTHQWVYEEGWLEKFLTLLDENSDWLQTSTFSDYRKNNRPLGKIYLPAASYFEMWEWSLPTAASSEFEEIVRQTNNQENGSQIKKFLKGGFWRNFLSKYSEANNLYQKMMRVSEKVHRSENNFKKKSKRKGFKDSVESQSCSYLLEKSLSALWAGQCNCSYWHGIFGGLYLPLLRQAVYAKLIEAENLSEQVSAILQKNEIKKEKDISCPTVEWVDFDTDGVAEVIVESNSQNLYLAPGNGGVLFEWDFKPAHMNVANVLTRRPESYHKKILQNLSSDKPAASDSIASIHDIVQVKEKGLENLISYDWYPRASLIDHFLHPHTKESSFRRCQYGEQGDFILQPYDCASKKNGNSLSLNFYRQGLVWIGEDRREISVRKIVQCSNDDNTLKITYAITNHSFRMANELWFAPEFNFSFSVPDLEKDKSFTGLKEWARTDPYLFFGLRIGFSENTDGWIFPLETVSNS
ncbi:MAG: DUF1926 domain-containing protein, partial [Elusimicrobia bacterium]|nr:DUF1926 domain-containing protein [Elusimicrobiota bacterium]